MLRTHRWLACVLGALGVAGLIWCGSQAAGQVVIQEVKVQVAQPPVMVGGVKGKKKGTADPKDSDGTTTQYSAIKLTEKSEYRKFIEVARDCIKGSEWNDAVTALQAILDNEKDYYVQVRDKDARGNEFLRWTSVKYEANNLLGSMADDGLDVYELRFGAKARAMLEDAKAKGDEKLLGEVGQRFMHTRAGIEGNDLLATHFLDRGQFFMSALRFEKLLGVNPERSKLSDLTLFKAALAYRRAGDVKNSEAVWAKLEPRLRERGGMQMGDDMIAIAKLHAVLEEIPRPDIFSPHDWAMIRGNKENSAQAKGTPPLLDSILWKRALLLDKSDETGQVDKDVIDLETAAARRVDAAVNKVLSLNNVPVMPGFYPIAVNRLLIYRTYTGLSAVYLHDEDEKDDGKIVKRKAGEIKWRTFPLEATLASILSNGKIRGTLDSWLDTSYLPTGSFSSILYENTSIGTLSCDHRFVYAIDDLAVPPPGSAFGNPNNPFMQPQVVQLAEGLRPLVMQNSLCAFDLESGRAKWQLGDPKRRDDPFNDSHFLGVPISVGGKLYVLNEKHGGPTGDSELRLICIDPTKITDGRPLIVQTQELGSVQQQARVTQDVTRRTHTVHLGYGEGILVCPTNAGEVLGVDLTSKSLAWAYPYRESSPQTVNLPGAMPGNMRGGVVFGPGGAMNMAGGVTVASWKSSPPVIVEGKVVFTAPDATSVHCINLRDGTPVWKKRQMDGDLFLAGVFQGKAIVVGRSSIRALDIHKGGDMVWYQATGDMPAGQGVASKNVYYLPLKKGEILAVDVESGQVKAHNKAKDPDKTPLGNLVFYEGTVIAQSPTEIVAYPQLQARLDAAAAALRTDPENPDKLVNRGELYLADGQVQKAVDDLQRALSKNPVGPLAKRAKTNLYEALTQLLQTEFVVASAKYLPEYAELCKVTDDAKEHQQRQARYFRIVGQGREAQGNLVEAFQMYREFGSLPIHRDQGGIAVLDDPTHRVPVDVWLRGRVSAMFAKATADQRAPLEKKIVEEWKLVEGKKDANAIRSFVGMFDVPFPVGREARLRLAESIIEQNSRNDFLEAELSLHQLRSAEFTRDPASGGRALAALAALEEKKGTVESMKQAAAYYRELASLFPGVVVRDGKTGSKLLDELASDKRFLPYLAESGTLWGEEKIAARELSVGHSAPALQGFSFQPEGDLTPFMKRHRLILDPTNAANPQLRLVDLTGGDTRWSTSLGSIPMNFQFFQYLYQQKGVVNNFAVGGTTAGYHPNHRYRYYQVKGHLVVFQVGTQVYCLDANDGKMLWQQPLAEQIQQGNPPQMFVNQVLPDAEGRLELILINQFNGQRTRMPIGCVGSVQASYVALLTQKGLVVLDPLRGTTLWKKMDVPPATHAFGDDQYLFLVDNADGSTGAGRTFRATDGTPLDPPDFGTLYQHRVSVLGRRILAGVPTKDGLVMRLYDIPTGKDIWSKTYAGKPTVLRTEDPSITGIVDGNTGKLVVLDVATGQELISGNAVRHRIALDDLKNLKDPLLLADRDRFYVALSQPVDSNKVGGAVLHNNFNNGVRCYPVNGWVAAFHRKSGKTAGGVEYKAGDMAWHSSKRIENQMMLLEQFELLPVMLFSSRYNELIGGGAQGNRWITATLSVHKSNGKLVFDSGNRPSNSNAQFDAFNLDLKAGTINMIGFSGTLQHFIDDGRKVPLPPGATTMTSPPPAALDLRSVNQMPGVRILPARIMVAPALPAAQAVPVKDK